MKHLRNQLQVNATTLMTQFAVLGVTGIALLGLYHGYRFAKSTWFEDPIDLNEYEG